MAIPVSHREPESERGESVRGGWCAIQATACVVEDSVISRLLRRHRPWQRRHTGETEDMSVNMTWRVYNAEVRLTWRRWIPPKARTSRTAGSRRKRCRGKATGARCSAECMTIHGEDGLGHTKLYSQPRRAWILLQCARRVGGVPVESASLAKGHKRA